MTDTRGGPRRAVAVWLGALSALIGAAAGLALTLYHDLPEINNLGRYRPSVVTAVLDRHGRPVAEIYQERRIWLPYAAMPKTLVQAVVATEDARFCEHRGLRLLSVARALLADIRAGRRAQGGSTITQQLAKLLFLTPEKSVARKIKEALLAIQIERAYTKEEILELYLNQINLGSGAYGVEAAADLALKRRATVLKRMAAAGYISDQAAVRESASPIALAPPRDGQRLAPHFVEMVRQDLADRYGEDRLYRDGFEVTTSLDLDLQRAAESAVAKGLAARKDRGASGPMEAALVALGPMDGSILALVGGRDFSRSQFNRVTQARRQPGSAFKPFVYLAALDAGFSPADIVVDSPVTYPGRAGGAPWTPTNYNERFHGPVTLRAALEQSLNVATIKLMDRVGTGAVTAMARRMGIHSPLENSLSLALGVAVVSPLELTAAYAPLANGGLRVEPGFILSVRAADGELLEEAPPKVADAIRPEIAYTLTTMLRGVIERGTGKPAAALDRPAAGKTGTTNDYRDAWFVGYTPGLVAGVWLGYDDNHPAGRGFTGGQAAAPIWLDFMRAAPEGAPARDFPKPSRVVTRLIDRTSGKLATPLCADTIEEAFVEGTEPREYCNAETQRKRRI
ncbi:MAG: transglycosylase domain-containing protein [Nitrospinae bacterium]|nr:transglycosylase domain-containing protein [Nitrospinota bacterium]